MFATLLTVHRGEDHNWDFLSNCQSFLDALQLGELLKKIEQDLLDAKSTLKEKQVAYGNYVKKVSTIEKSIKDYDKSRGSRLKDLEKKIKALKIQMQSSSKDLKVCNMFDLNDYNG